MGRADETRDDPFWEFGSFGVTGCHSASLLNPTKAAESAGTRLAFAQGGPTGTRLVYLSPPITIREIGTLREARWCPREMPFRYEFAPLLIDNEGRSDFPFIQRKIRGTKRTTPVSAFASRFRSRRRPLDSRDSRTMVERYTEIRSRASESHIAESYTQAMPKTPPGVIKDREGVYRKIIERSEKDTARRKRCRGKPNSRQPRRKRRC